MIGSSVGSTEPRYEGEFVTLREKCDMLRLVLHKDKGLWSQPCTCRPYGIQRIRVMRPSIPKKNLSRRGRGGGGFALQMAKSSASLALNPKP